MKRFSFITLMALSVFAVAQADTWKLDKAHSEANFTVSHMVISEVTGNFKEFDIKFEAPGSDFTNASIEAVIKVNSINTDQEKRDGHLKSDDFFNAEKYPEIIFKSTSFEKVDENKYNITGDLTIRGTTKTVTFGAVHKGTLKTQQGTLSAWKAILDINRFDYGLKWNRLVETGGLVVGENVSIVLNLEFNK